MLRTINCKECNNEFKYKFDINELRGGRKKYCDKCLKIKRIISKRESERISIQKPIKKIITKKVVIDDAIKLVLDLNKYSNIIEKSTQTYDKILKTLPNDYITRGELRRQYRQVIKNEVQ